jgi:hypothetical protein
MRIKSICVVLCNRVHAKTHYLAIRLVYENGEVEVWNNPPDEVARMMLEYPGGFASYGQCE